MIPKGYYRLSFSHLVFYVSTFVIAIQLYFIWGQSKWNYGFSPRYSHRGWVFNPDLHANIHTLSQDQCDAAFPQLYHSLEHSVRLRQGNKVHAKDIEIEAGRCMLRVLVHQGEVGRQCLFF